MLEEESGTSTSGPEFQLLFGDFTHKYVLDWNGLTSKRLLNKLNDIVVGGFVLYKYLNEDECAALIKLLDCKDSDESLGDIRGLYQ